MPPTNRFISTQACTFTPNGGSAIPIRGVQNVTLNEQASDVSEGGDGDLINTSAGVVQIDPQVSLEFLNAAVLNGVAPGVIGTLTWTLLDANNKAVSGGGALIFTLVNAYYMPGAVNMPFRQFAKATPTFKSFSVDGQTSPLSVSAA